MAQAVYLLTWFVQFMWIMHGTRLATATLGYRFCPFHHEGAAECAYVAGWSCFDRELAFRIVGTRIKESKSSASLNHLTILTTLCRAGRASDSCLGARFFLGILFYKFALGVV